MGALIEINDTLKLKQDAVWPANLLVGQVYDFTIAGRRLYHLAPTRVFLVAEQPDGRWDYVGHAQIESLTINPLTEMTSGVYRVQQLYPRDYANMLNVYEPPACRTGFVGV